MLKKSTKVFMGSKALKKYKKLVKRAQKKLFFFFKQKTKMPPNNSGKVINLKCFVAEQKQKLQPANRQPISRSADNSKRNL